MKSGKCAGVKTQLCQVGNYQMTGRQLGKGHFARVEEATHRLLGKTVAVKILDTSKIQEEYARRHLHREPRVLARLRHPCIAMLYETMMCGPRLYLVLEACGGGDLCTLVLQQRDSARGLTESRTRHLAAHLVSAVRHMHACGVVHRDLKMENIMLDTTKQFVKIVDFGLSNVWERGSTLRTPCGSLEYAAPELFVEHRRYGPEVDMWSVGVIMFGMVTGGLPFTVPAGGGGAGDRPLFSQIISKGIGRKQSLALSHVSSECRGFIRMLLQPDRRLRLSAERAAADAWLRRDHPSSSLLNTFDRDTTTSREIYRQIAEASSMCISEVTKQIRAEPYGALGGMLNIKSHQLLLQASRRDLRPYTAQSFTAPPPPAPHNYNQERQVSNESHLGSKSLDPLKYPIKVERTNEKKMSTRYGDTRKLPSITESQVSLYNRSRIVKLEGAKTTLRKVSALDKEQTVKPGSASAGSKIKDFCQRAGDCMPRKATKPSLSLPSHSTVEDTSSIRVGWSRSKDIPNLRRQRR